MATVTLPETTRALYPFKSHFLTLSDGKRMHYVDEGPEDGEALVFVHGYPMWSFIYRALLVYYAAQGFRCVAMDHIGYGLSDKPSAGAYHTLRRHTHNLVECLAALDLRQITLVMEDWGGPFGVGYALRQTPNIRRLVLMNTWAFQDTYTHWLYPLIRFSTRRGLGDLLFRSPNLLFSLGVQQWSGRRLSAAVLTAYKGPFREARHRASLIQFPRMISTTPLHPSAPDMRTLEQGLASLKGIPALILWGEENQLFPPEIAHHWKKMLPRAKGPLFIPQARHFLTEDNPDTVIQQLDYFLERS
ncbi:MAG: alpha/beta fold hydrolase [Chloroflexi bacterium]|nr:alpha/beta fold hydrolase [Chloroflexota bacterium]